MLKDLIKSRKFENENLLMIFYSNHSLSTVSQMKDKQRNGFELDFFEKPNVLSYLTEHRNNEQTGISISLWADLSFHSITQRKRGQLRGLWILSNRIEYIIDEKVIFQL